MTRFSSNFIMIILKTAATAIRRNITVTAEASAGDTAAREQDDTSGETQSAPAGTSRQKIATALKAKRSVASAECTDSVEHSEPSAALVDASAAAAATASMRTGAWTAPIVATLVVIGCLCIWFMMRLGGWSGASSSNSFVVVDVAADAKIATHSVDRSSLLPVITNVGEIVIPDAFEAHNATAVSNCSMVLPSVCAYSALSNVISRNIIGAFILDF